MAYAYDNNRRLTTIASSTEGTFNYGYDPTMKLHVNRVGFPNGAYITNTFETMGQVTGTYLKDGSGTILNSHVYAYDPFNFKDISRQTRTDGSYVDYNYDGIGQLKSALGKEAGGSSRLNETFRYSYDHAGNLSHRTNDILDESFTVDTWDKLVSVTRSGRITVMGATSAAATNVTVNTSNATLYADNTFASTNHTLTATGFTAIAKDSYGRCDTNTVSNLPESVFVSYDDDGRLVNDGRLGFQYDEENQLIAVWDDVVASWKSEFVYDGKMRRRIRKEFRWQNGTWVQTNEVRYIYDGNVVIQERDAMNSLSVTYTRGPDLSRSFEGAGGIGGLLARRDDRAATPAYYHADRLGNVTMLISPQQIPVAKYFYDPFGTILSSSGPLADANLYRFSSKESHTLSGLTFYAMRYYSARMHRWLNPDPIQELGGINLSSFVGNSPVRAIDPFGLSFWDYVPLIGTIRGCTSNSEGSNPGDYATVPFPNCQECKTDPEGAEKKCRDRIAILSSRYNAVAQASGIFRGALDVVATTVGGILITRGGFVLGGVLTGYSVADVLCTFNSIFAIGNAAKQAADNFCQCEPKPKN
jgi:RHS repeat-associated protein